MITTINEFKMFLESTNATITIETVSSLTKIIQSSDDETVFDRIRYFSSFDLGYMSERECKPYFVVLTENTTQKIIGIAKVGYFSGSAMHENQYSISFFSIDKDYRYSGYARLMCDELFKYAKEKGYEMSTSQYTVLGKRQLEKLFVEYANKYNVTFYNNEGMHDNEYKYEEKDGKLYRKDEI